jgi:hypothetical protein
MSDALAQTAEGPPSERHQRRGRDARGALSGRETREEGLTGGARGIN